MTQSCGCSIMTANNDDALMVIMADIDMGAFNSTTNQREQSGWIEQRHDTQQSG